ncbi:MAG: PSD1 and planctomycete cytochrome C domain-containing protein [Pirellulaceae bacterium]
MWESLLKTSGLLAMSVMIAGDALAAEPLSFTQDVRPILSQHCFKCHGPDELTREGGLRLDLWESASSPADSGGIAIVPGATAESELARRIRADEDELMPPPSSNLSLSESQKAVLERWIHEGAAFETHWAFRLPQKVEPAAVEDDRWDRSAIDRFAFAKLAELGLKPQDPSNPYEQIRRVFLDLTGLPPTTEDADRFADNPSDEAYEQIVDDLLLSPGYGERWARKWMDLARYADTNGYEKDRVRTIWPYRDWVINALQKDMPFDQFTIEQLAGDMLPNATVDQRIATGFHRNTMLNEEGGIDPLEFRFYAMTDRTATTGTVWLGLTIGCAQCHTHKYDPISHHEYYGLFALLNNADEPELPLPDKSVEAQRSEIEGRIETLTSTLAERFPVPEDATWTTPTASVLGSDHHSEVQIQSQNIVRVTKLAEPTETISISLAVPKGTYDCLLVEAIADPSLPGKGPGLTKHGNFVLTELSAKAGDSPIEFSDAVADFSQDGFPANHAIDGKPNTGWAIHGEGEWNVNRRLTVKFEQPVRFDGSETLVVTIANDYGKKHVLGNVRISIGTSVDATIPIEVRRKELLGESFDNWVKDQSSKVNHWQIAHPASATATTPALTILDDESILASGDFRKSDTYDVQFSELPAGVTGFRLEVIPDERLPKGGPGAVYYEGPLGDFFLSEVSFNQGEQRHQVIEATQSFANGDNTAAKCIDGNKQSGWSIDGGQRRRHVAVFRLAEPTAEASPLSISMLCERWYAPGIGRFRWSYTSEPVGQANDLPSDVAEALMTPRESWSPEQRSALMNAFLQHAPELKQAREEIDELRQSLIPTLSTLVMQERPSEHPRVTHRYHRGEFLSPQDEVKPHTPAALTRKGEQPTTRLEFAKWLVSENNPLTARVTVNRAWEAFFGRGLVRTSQDFGFQGDAPTHPELLDYLAVDFMENGWSMKQLHKQIVLSQVYRQSSQVSPEALAIDPDNRWLSRGPRVRLDAEVIRDQALAVARLLSQKRGGPSVFPPQPANVTTEGAYRALAWNVSQGEDRFRRSLYTFTKRTSPFALTATFDAPSGEACVARREITNTPLQALSLLNDVTFMQAARELGKRTQLESGEDRAKLARLFRQILIRPAMDDDLDDLLGYLARQRVRLREGELHVREIALEASDEAEESSSDCLLDRAAWTLVARVLMNLDEFITK